MITGSKKWLNIIFIWAALAPGEPRLSALVPATKGVFRHSRQGASFVSTCLPAPHHLSPPAAIASILAADTAKYQFTGKINLFI